jgi:hypothetical protein
MMLAAGYRFLRLPLSVHRSSDQYFYRVSALVTGGARKGYNSKLSILKTITGIISASRPFYEY